MEIRFTPKDLARVVANWYDLPDGDYLSRLNVITHKSKGLSLVAQAMRGVWHAKTAGNESLERLKDIEKDMLDEVRKSVIYSIECEISNALDVCWFGSRHNMQLVEALHQLIFLKTDFDREDFDTEELGTALTQEHWRAAMEILESEIRERQDEKGEPENEAIGDND